MVARTPLAIVRAACGEIRLAQPSAVIGSTDPNVISLLEMVNEEGAELAKAKDWTVLIRTETLTTVDGQAEYDLPDDYDHLIRDTEWDRTGIRPLYGPLGPQDWESIQSGGISGLTVNRTYRIVRSATSTSRKVVVSPTPSSTDDNQTLAYQYVSNAWCSTADGTTLQTEFALDSDVTLLDPALLKKGTVVRFKRSIGLDYASEAAEYADMLSRAKAYDRPSRSLSLTGQARFRLVSEDNVPVGTLGS